MYFTDLPQAKICSKRILAEVIVCSTYSYNFGSSSVNILVKIFSYIKRQISATNHVVFVFNVLILIALAASEF